MTKDQLQVNTLASKPRMEQERNRNLAAKFENVNKVSKKWMDEMSSVIENQFKIMGEKQSEWNQKFDDSFMDKSLQINVEAIMQNVKMVLNQMKENPPL